MRLPHPIVVVALIVAGYAFWKNPPAWPDSHPSPAAAGTVASPAVHRHVYDEAHVLPAQDIPRFEQYMNWIVRESDVDVRIVFVSGTDGKTLEELAADKVDALRIGGRTRDARGILLIYDMQGQRLKIEVGYGLEGYFPDAFVSYLIHDHAQMFFASRDLTTGLRLMLRLLQHRIREAVIGNDFDPRILDKLQRQTDRAFLSGGAGAAARLPLGGNDRPADDATTGRAGFNAQATPAETYATYLRWLAQPQRNPAEDFLTPESRSYLAGLPISRAYADFIFLAEDGKRFDIFERQDLALLAFTGTPFVSPHFFVRQNGVWRMDILAEVHNTREHVGGIYTWSYVGRNDAYTLAFTDLLTDMKGYRRFRNGDNRPLLIRGD